MCSEVIIINLIFAEKTYVFYSGPFIWITISKCKDTDPVTAAESVMLTLKGHIIMLIY